MHISSLCLITDRAYPHGGGEAYMLDSIADVLARYPSARVFWITFAKKGVTVDSVTPRPDHKFVEILIHGFSLRKMEAWLRYIEPSVVHHQGHYRLEVARVCGRLKIPLATGVHYWNGCVELHPMHHNRKILANSALHKPHKNFAEVTEHALVYFPSEFVRRCVKEICGSPGGDGPVVSPIGPSPEQTIAPNDASRRRYLTLINCDGAKGGSVLEGLVRMTVKGELKVPEGVTFLGVGGGGSIPPGLVSLSQQHPGIIRMIPFQNGLTETLRDTLVLLQASQCDETFCRVLLEAMNEGCICLHSQTGNLPFLAGLDPETAGSLPVKRFGEPSAWATELRKIFDMSPEEKTLRRERARSRALVVQDERGDITDVLLEAVRRSPRYTVGVFTVWSDQGLGIQCRHYVNHLQRHGYRTAVFSFMPYNRISAKRTPEWSHPSVYYSPNIREKITDAEVKSFVRAYKIGVMLIPEICFSRVFEIADLLRSLGVRTVAVPNVEICRRSEMHRLGISFDRVIANNMQAVKVFEEFGVPNFVHVGFWPYVEEKKEASRSLSNLRPGPPTLRFLVVGGKNPFNRKKVHSIVEAFEGLPSNLPFSLTVTLNVKNNPRWASGSRANGRIQVINRHLLFSEIEELYATHHVYIALSSNEGLGLNLFETLQHGLYLLTYDTEPFSEIAPGNIQVPAHFERMIDNPEAVIEGVDFSVEELRGVLQSLDPADIWAHLSRDHSEDYAERLRVFTNRFLGILQW